MLTSLSLSNVRYDVIDENKRFYGRVVNQLQQQYREDLPLTATTFQFLLALCRANYTTFVEIEQLLAGLLSRLDENNVGDLLEAVRIFLLYVTFHRRNSSQNAFEGDSEESRASLNYVKDFLCKESDFLFSNAPMATAHIWILLLNLARNCHKD